MAIKSKYYNFEHEIKPPFRVDVRDLFIGDPEEAYEKVGYCDTLEEAIKKASKICEDSIQEFASIEKWRITGVAGLVYDSQGWLVWSGTDEYPKKLKE